MNNDNFFTNLLLGQIAVNTSGVRHRKGLCYYISNTIGLAIVVLLVSSILFGDKIACLIKLLSTL